MRFPSLSDLDREQRRIYGEAPSDGAIIVVGPPGTGKTVMAFHRAQKVKQMGQQPQVIMFNKVLRRYTSTRSDVAPGVPVRTMHAWVESWWRGATRSRVPKANGNAWHVDWNAICAASIVAISGGTGAQKLGWGHLLIDEGQDFPPEMYLAIGLMQSQLAKVDVPTQVTIFADDNQRLQAEMNSRVSDIRRNLFIASDPSRNFVLTKNFRNTRPIASFAAYFQVGNESGVADLPDTDGEVPRVLFGANDRDIAEFIARKAKMSPGKQIGVLVYGRQADVKRAFNQVKSRLDGAKGAPTLQMYLSGNENHSDDKLDFDSANTITFLHVQSAKGLEFDIVFFIGMEAMQLDSSGFMNERMALYVMCSRARSELYVAFDDISANAPLPSSACLLPRPSENLCRYVGLGALEGLMAGVEAQLEGNCPMDLAG
jgi:superfamily I DNA/RNA helicase